MRRAGFTLVEVVIALVILAAGVLAISSSAARMSRAALSAERNAAALQAVQDRITRVLVHPEYADLDSLFDGVEEGVGEMGFTRTTEVERRKVDLDNGEVVDFTEVTVAVDGPHLAEPVVRSTIVGAP